MMSLTERGEAELARILLGIRKNWEGEYEKPWESCEKKKKRLGGE